MKTVTKKDLVEVLNKKVGLSKRTLLRFLDELLDEIKLALERNEEVQIVRFGSFIPYRTKEKIGKNLKTKENVRVPSFKKVKFKLAPQFKAELQDEILK